jgi:hypothetical protein
MLPPRQEGGRLAGDAEESEARPDDEEDLFFDPDVALSCIVSRLPSLGSRKFCGRGRGSGCRVVRAGLPWCWV